MARRLRAAGDDIDLLVMLNAPSMDYIDEFHPMFDDEGALTDASGEWIDLDADPRSKGEKLRAAWADGGVPEVARFVADAVSRRARWRFRTAQLRYALRFKRPLPVALRENRYFQRISEQAQADYHPLSYDGDITVFRAAGLYHRDDLGWRDATTGSVECLEVLGDQPVPRATMKEPVVARVARELDERLVEQELAAADRHGGEGRS